MLFGSLEASLEIQKQTPAQREYPLIHILDR